MPRPETVPVRPLPERGEDRFSHFASFAASCTTRDQPRIRQMAQPIVHGIDLEAGGDLIHERFVGKRILQALRRAQRAGKKRRADVVRQDALARDCSRSAAACRRRIR